MCELKINFVNTRGRLLVPHRSTKAEGWKLQKDTKDTDENDVDHRNDD